MTIIVKQVYWYISQISGERLQDHWSSSFVQSFIFIQCIFNLLFRLFINIQDACLFCDKIWPVILSLLPFTAFAVIQ